MQGNDSQTIAEKEAGRKDTMEGTGEKLKKSTTNPVEKSKLRLHGACSWKKGGNGPRREEVKEKRPKSASNSSKRATFQGQEAK